MPQANLLKSVEYFFAPNGRFEPCGMFSSHHIIASCFCALAVIFLVVLQRKNIIKFNKTKTYKFCAILLTVLETVKISHSFIYGDYYLDAWFPLSYCGLFIFALWMAGFGNNRIKMMGEVFISYGCPCAGIAFLIFPTTSLMIFPIWHYFSLYSLFFHSLMIFVGIVTLSFEKQFTVKSFFNYAVFVITFSIPAVIINSAFNSNLMNLREPYNIPIQLLQNIYTSCGICYTLLAVFCYMLVPIVVAFIFRKIKPSISFKPNKRKL